jgi:hypothetical protein
MSGKQLGSSKGSARLPGSSKGSARLPAVLLCGGFHGVFVAAYGVAAVVAAPTTIHVVRERTSFDHTASKFTYLGNYNCFFVKYWAALAEPEPMRTELAKQRALASAPPVSTYGAEDAGAVDEYFAPGRYARYERSTTFVPSGHGDCALTEVDQTKVQLAQGTRLINTITKNGVTTVSEIPLQPPPEPFAEDAKQAGAVVTELAPAWGGGFAPGTVRKVGEKSVAGEVCDLMTSSGSTFGMAIDLCVWRGMKTFPTPLGPKEIILFSETRAAAAAPAGVVTDPIALNTGEVLHWTEQATEFHINEAFAESVFTPPRASK